MFKKNPQILLSLYFAANFFTTDGFGVRLIFPKQLDAIPMLLLTADWTGRWEEHVASLRNFPQIQQKVFYSAFSLSHQSVHMSSMHTVMHMAQLWLCKLQFLLFFTLVINYRHIVLVQIGQRLLDSFGASYNLTLISVFDFNLGLRGPSSALFSLCLLYGGGSSSYRTSCHSSLGADL